jgi:transcriptional regulator with XRE-family HTH domain
MRCDMKNLESVGMAVKMARTSMKESQANFGKRFGVGHAAVGVWERDGKVPQDRWKQMLEECGIDIEAIMRENVNIATGQKSYVGNHMEVNKNHIASDLSPEEQHFLSLVIFRFLFNYFNLL